MLNLPERTYDQDGIDTQLTNEICRRQPELDRAVVYKLVSDLHHECFL